MKTPAVIASLTVAGSLAFAAGQSRVTQPPFAPAPPTLPTMGGGETVAMMSSTQCNGGAPLNWFTEVHLLPTCANLVWSGTYINSARANMNNDGAIEVISLLRNGGESALSYAPTTHLASGNPWNPGCCLGTYVLFATSITPDPVTPTITIHPVMRGQLLLDALCALGVCNPSVFEFYWRALHDIDGDGDLDAVFSISGTEMYSSHSVNQYIWVENTAPSNPPLAADINEDGYVDAKDLAMVLSAWTL
jgi:hypothetical protein